MSFVITALIIFVLLPPILVTCAERMRREREKRESKEHTSEQVAYLTTYQNENVSNEDIMKFFTSQCYLYLGQLNNFVHYLYIYKVYQETDRQNYAWHIKTTKDEYNWVTIITIEFCFSNGWFWVQVANHKFNYDDKSSTTTTYYGKDYRKEIDIALLACRIESHLMWKKII
jgi:hypothetical protein